jgi:hypothetical protein
LALTRATQVRVLLAEVLFNKHPQFVFLNVADDLAACADLNAGAY